ncbi:MAG: response regulator [Sulfuricellaceae bacterium]
MTAHDHILVVDDDAEIRSLLGDYLRKNGYQVSTVGDGKGMRAAFDQGRVDLIVLDLMLPGDDGLVLCRDLRARSSIPIIMLTARGDETDRIVGLEMGADDYLPKPFNPRELLARIKSVLRRARNLPDSANLEDAQCIHFAERRLNVHGRQLLSPEGVVIPLSGAEYRLLKIFLTHANRVLSRDQLMDWLQGREADPFERSIDVQVSRLRNRLGDDAKEPAIIKTVRGEGYVLVAQVVME